MTDSQMKALNNLMNKLRSKVEKFEPTDDTSQNRNAMEDIDDLIKSIEDKIEEIDNDMNEDEDLSGNKPLINKLTEQKNEFNIIKNNYNRKAENARSAINQELLMRGELKGVEKKKAQRDMALDQVKEVDNQGLIIDSIGKYTRDAVVNLANMNDETKRQGEQIDRVGEKVVNADQKVKVTGKVFNSMDRRLCCRKFIVWIGIFVLFLVNIIMAFLILGKYFGWWPWKKEEKIKGIDNLGGELNYDSLKDEGCSFVMLMGGSGKVKKDKLDEKLSKAKDKDIKAGVYWTIIGNDVNDAIEQAGKAKDFTKENSVILKDLKYGFYFKIENDTILKDNADNFCKDIEGLKCGISLKYKHYEDYFKNKNDKNHISSFWIDSDDKFDKDPIIDLWKTKDKVKIGGTNYDVIQARKF